MILYGEDILKDGEVYRALVGKDPEDDSSAIRYLQPRDDLLYCQEAHESALDYLFEQEEDLEVLEKGLLPDESN